MTWILQRNSELRGEARVIVAVAGHDRKTKVTAERYEHGVSWFLFNCLYELITSWLFDILPSGTPARENHPLSAVLGPFNAEMQRGAARTDRQFQTFEKFFERSCCAQFRHLKLMNCVLKKNWSNETKDTLVPVSIMLRDASCEKILTCQALVKVNALETCASASIFTINRKFQDSK